MRSRCCAAPWYASGVGPLLPCSAKMSSSMVHCAAHLQPRLYHTEHFLYRDAG